MARFFIEGASALMRARCLVLLLTACVACGGMMGWDAQSAPKMAAFAASQRWSCPQDRLTLLARPSASVAPPSPPSDVAGDPERLAIWQRNNPDHGSPQFTVSGCGKTAVFNCLWGPGGVSREETPGWGCAPIDPTTAP